MITLHLHHSTSDRRHQVTLRVDGTDAVLEARSAFEFESSAAESERVRWYFEDYLEYPLDPAPRIAERVERHLADVGKRLFTSVFDGNPRVRELWTAVEGRLTELSMEIHCDPNSDSTIPWELVVEPRTGQPLALLVRSFVRASTRFDHREAPMLTGALRVLLVICRPGGSADVPFRSVARSLLDLTRSAGNGLHVDVLRPPTFRRLEVVLETAKTERRPYHVVHFDGHGAYLAVSDLPSSRSRPTAPASAQAPAARRGYLVFEDDHEPGSQPFVDGTRIGQLLARSDVAVLLLNACRSAYSEAASEPRSSAPGHDETEADTQLRAYGSLASEATNAGLVGVAAMRYNVYVATAAQFVRELYPALMAGLPLGEAVTTSRRALAAKPHRMIGFTPMALQDWSVPVVYQVTPVSFAPADPGSVPRTALLSSQADVSRTSTGRTRRANIRFEGRDGTLYALDRAFDRHRVVLMHSYAGSGKTATAVESVTGMLRLEDWGPLAHQATPNASAHCGVVLFSDFTQHMTTSQLCNQVADAFAAAVRDRSVTWSGLDPQQRQRLALQLLASSPVLWIWDGIDGVGDDEGSADRTSSADHRGGLARLLRAVAATGRGCSSRHAGSTTHGLTDPSWSAFPRCRFTNASSSPVRWPSDTAIVSTKSRTGARSCGTPQATRR